MPLPSPKVSKSTLYSFLEFFCFGFGTAYTPSVVIVSQWFCTSPSHRTLALAIASSGVGVGSLTLAPLLVYLLDEFGTHSTFLLLGGLSSHLVLFGMAMRPVRKSKRLTEIHKRFINTSLPKKPPLPLEPCRTSEEDIQCEFATSLNSRHSRTAESKCLFTDWRLIIFFINNVLHTCGALILMVSIVEISLSANLSEEDGASFLSTFGICNMFGRPLAGILLTCCRPRTRALTFDLYQVATAILGLTLPLFCLPHPSFHTFLIYSTIFGVSFGLQIGCLAEVTVEIFGTDRISLTYGITMLANGFGALVGGPLAGWLTEHTHSLCTSLYLGCLIIELAVILLTPLSKKHSVVRWMCSGHSSSLSSSSESTSSPSSSLSTPSAASTPLFVGGSQSSPSIDEEVE